MADASSNNNNNNDIAEFQWYLNRQGPEGKQGIQGEPGVSPVITVDTNQPLEYKLSITDINGTFKTPNLRPTIVDAGGSYLRIDPTSKTISANNLDTASTTVLGGVYISDSEDLENADGGSVPTLDSTKKLVNDLRTEAKSQYVDLTSSQLIDGTKSFEKQIVVPSIYGFNYLYTKNHTQSVFGLENYKDEAGTLANNFGVLDEHTILRGNTLEYQDSAKNYYNVIHTGNISEYAPQPDLSNYVTLNTNQSINGEKTFNTMVRTQFVDVGGIGMSSFGAILNIGGPIDTKWTLTHLGTKYLLRYTRSDGFTFGETESIAFSTSQNTDLIVKRGSGSEATSSKMFDEGNITKFIDGTTITFTDGKLHAVGGGSTTEYTLPEASADVLGGVKLSDSSTIGWTPSKDSIYVKVDGTTITADDTGKLKAIVPDTSDLTAKITELQDTIRALTTRITALETEINGGKA